MKVLFLDFDGVLNPFAKFSRIGEFSKNSCSHIQYLLDSIPDLRIVVSSSWRTYGLPAMRDILKQNGIDPTKIIAITDGPKEEPGETSKVHHIVHWLQEHPEIDSYVIVDDEVELPHLKHKYVKPNPSVGMNLKDMESAMKILASESRLH